MAMADSQRWPDKLCLIKNKLYIHVYNIIKTEFFSSVVPQPTCAFLLQENIKELSE